MRKNSQKNNVKKALILSIILIATLIQVSAQTLTQNETDEFTGSTVKHSSWETLNASMKYTAYFRISKINDFYYFDLKMAIGSTVFSIDKDQEIMFKLSNGKIIKIPNLEYTITCEGCGARGYVGSGIQGIQVSYNLTSEQIKELKNNSIVKIRIYTNIGYVENNLKPKYYQKILNSLLIIK